MRTGKAISLALFLLIVAARATCCQCPLIPLTRGTVERYELVFRGTIESVSECGDRPGDATFRISELYRGNAPEIFHVTFACDDPCAQKMLAGDEWIIYGNYSQVTAARMDWCSRSRKLISVEREDFYKVNYGNSFDDEAAFLRENFGLHRLMNAAPVTDKGRNIRPDIFQTSMILICSLAGMVLFYFVFRKLFR